MTFAPTPRPRSITIGRLDIDVRGIDASTVQAALNALPAATASALEMGDGRRAMGDGRQAMGARPSVDDVARAIASQIAATVATHERTATTKRGSFASLRMTK